MWHVLGEWNCKDVKKKTPEDQAYNFSSLLFIITCNKLWILLKKIMQRILLKIYFSDFFMALKLFSAIHFLLLIFSSSFS